MRRLRIFAACHERGQALHDSIVHTYEATRTKGESSDGHFDNPGVDVGALVPCVPETIDDAGCRQVHLSDGLALSHSRIARYPGALLGREF